MLRVGLTGGIASGKTTASEHFADLGVPVIDADQIARQVMEPGQAAYPLVIKLFGQGVLDDQGHFNRDAIRELVFSDENKRRDLEAIVHPLVRTEITNKTEILKADYCIVVVPLLVETGFLTLVDRVLVVDVDSEQQKKRLSARSGLSQKQIEGIMAAQTDRETRLSHADDVIDNSGSIGELRRQVEGLHKKYQAMAAK